MIRLDQKIQEHMQATTLKWILSSCIQTKWFEVCKLANFLNIKYLLKEAYYYKYKISAATPSNLQANTTIWIIYIKMSPYPWRIADLSMMLMMVVMMVMMMMILLHKWHSALDKQQLNKNAHWDKQLKQYIY